MYRRLVAFALGVVAVAATALVIPLALSARDVVRSSNLSALLDQARWAADQWEVSARVTTDDSSSPLAPPSALPQGLSAVLPDGSVVSGPVPEQAVPLVDAARYGTSATLDTGSQGFAAAPAYFDEGRVGVVIASATSTQMNEGMGPRLLGLAILCLVLMAGAGLAAFFLARRTARPIKDLAATADALAAGDLTVRASASTLPEAADVGQALNRLAGRVEELLADERAATAELAHQLRTPLTVLSADIDAVPDETLRARLQEDLLSLHSATDEIITTARRPVREGLSARCDARDVVAGRGEFWRVLADIQGRDFQTTLADGPLPVRLTEYDLTTVVDILLQNVFVHTPEGTALRLAVGELVDRAAVEVVVCDAGPGFSPEPGTSSQSRPGSTGLGLAIAERLAAASGGELSLAKCADLGGAEVRLVLGAGT
jgi:signal transduction histidine kinase